MPTNTWRGRCRYCAKPVGVRKGLAEKSSTTGKWLVWHPRCEPAVAVTQAVRPQPGPVRTPYRDD